MGTAMNQGDAERLVSVRSLTQVISNQFTAIDLCLVNTLPMQALILMYVFMDVMAYLDCAADQGNVTRCDFVRWVERYLIPESGLRCSGDDLYGARCGLLHTYSSESDLSRRGKAVPIQYAWGPQASEQRLQVVIDEFYAGVVDAVPMAVSVDRLRAALATAVGRFFGEVKNDRSRLDLLLERAKPLFILQSADEL